MIVEAADFVADRDDTKDYKFGLTTRIKIIEGLEKFLAAVKDGRALIQNIEVSSLAGVDDFVIQTLTFKYAEGPPIYSANEIRDMKGFGPLP